MATTTAASTAPLSLSTQLAALVKARANSPQQSNRFVPTNLSNAAQISSAIRRTFTEVYNLHDRLTDLTSLDLVTRKAGDQLYGANTVSKELSTTGSSPLNVTGLPGVLAQSQPALAPNYPSLPTPNASTSIPDGTLAQLNGQLYAWSQSTQQWTLVTANFNPPGAWTSYTPSVTAGGSMTWTPSSSDAASNIFGKRADVRVKVVGTTGGTASDNVTVALSAGPVNNDQCLACSVDDGSGMLPASAVFNGTSFRVRKADGSVFALGSVTIIASGSYEAA